MIIFLKKIEVNIKNNTNRQTVWMKTLLFKLRKVFT